MPRITRAMSSLWTAKHASGVINLGKGHPHPKLLNLQALKDALLTVDDVSCMQYGRPYGYKPLCQQISAWYNQHDQQISPDNIMITTGSGPALGMTMLMLSSPGNAIIADGPAYFLSFLAFRDAGLEIIQVPTNENVLDLDALEAVLRDNKSVKFVYTVPFGNNPMGTTMNDSQKVRLLQLANKYDFIIISDEVYQFLLFDHPCPRGLFCFDDQNNPRVVALNSFSKLLGPGLRLGWICAYKPILQRLAKYAPIQSGGGMNPLCGAIVSQMLASGEVQRQIAHLRKYYRENCAVMCDAIEKYIKPLDNQLLYYRPTGGYFLFLRLHEGTDTVKLLDLAQEKKVSYFPGNKSSADQSQYTNYLRLCFAFVTADDIVEGIKRLAEAIKEYYIQLTSAT